MGHCIQGLLGKPESILTARSGRLWPTPIKLSQGYAFVPFYESVLDGIAIATNPSLPGFTYLTPELHQALISSSRAAEFVYLETEYFGGIGSQAAAAYQGEKVIFGPDSSDESPINSALRSIGVVKSVATDEFEAVGLSAIRAMDRLPDYEEFH